ncbi:MAG: mucoidy inhibitor MuiA family protein [Chloroflexia bacterium]|nr:mucoidy inhibitor MuiA family protein [Chloroflexia bacterium]
MMKFYNLKLNTLDDTLRENRKELKKLEKRLKVLTSEMSKFNQANLRTEKQVELKVFVKESTDIEVTISYIVYNANWSPVYDLRQNSESKKLGVAYNAIIRQATGERWEDVELKLSTARPQLSGTSPTLSPWYVDIFTYQPPSVPNKNQGKSKKLDMMMKSGSVAPEGLIQDEYAELEEEAAPMEIKEAKVETGATAVVLQFPELIQY